MTVEGETAHSPVRTATSLLINVSTLLQEPIGSLRQFEMDVLGEDCVGVPGGLVSPLRGSLRLLRTDQSILATAALSTTVDDVCGSCLEQIKVALELDFDEEFWPSFDVVTGLRIEPPPERAGFAAIDGQIDLSEAVRQYVEMERPMSPRCGSECPGLETNTSARPEIDPRWAALSTLQIESEGD